ncbi:MAG: hypothetical protein ACI8RZ_002833, partial [Myxococcota bacterium]
GATQPLGMHILSEPRVVVFMPPRRVDERASLLTEPASSAPITNAAKMKRRVAVQVPSGRPVLGAVPEHCSARIEVSRCGEPLMVSVLDCPARWRNDVAVAVWQWRFCPAKSGPERVSTTLTLDVPLQ